MIFFISCSCPCCSSRFQECGLHLQNPLPSFDIKLFRIREIDWVENFNSVDFNLKLILNHMTISPRIPARTDDRTAHSPTARAQCKRSLSLNLTSH